MQDGILILYAETGAITDVNPFLIRLPGCSREDSGKQALSRDIKASQDAFEILQKTEYIRHKDLPLRAKDGEFIQVEFVNNVYLAEDEKIIWCNIRVITERKQTQNALLKNQELLREQSTRDHLTGLFNRRIQIHSNGKSIKGLSLTRCGCFS
jgi:PAS domain S-box-containing protein